MNNCKRSHSRRNLLRTIAIGSSLTIAGLTSSVDASDPPPLSIRAFQPSQAVEVGDEAPQVARKVERKLFARSDSSAAERANEPAPFTPPKIISKPQTEPAAPPAGGNWVPRGSRLPAPLRSPSASNRSGSSALSARSDRSPWVAPRIDDAASPSERVAELPDHLQLKNRGSGRTPATTSADDEVIEVQPMIEEHTSTRTDTRSEQTITRNRVSLDSNEPIEDVVELSEEEIREQTQVDGDIDEESLRRLRDAIQSFPERKSQREQDVDPAPVAPENSPVAPHASLDSVQRAPAEPAPAAPPRQRSIVLKPNVAAMQPSIARVLIDYYNRPENAASRSPWGTFHLMLPFGGDANVVYGNRKYNSAGWLCSNRPCRGQRLLTTTRSGRIYVRQGPGLQGHQAQLLAMLAQINTETTYPLTVGRRQFNIEDLIRAEMADCRAGTELTFTLIGLSHYLPTDTYWTASDGSKWDFERLIAEELDQPIVGAACGGTHRLMGFSYALRQRRLEGLPVEGQWRRAEAFLNDFVQYAWTLQNNDGTFSTKWFEGPEDNRELDRKIQTTGHILEWLIFTANQEELQEERFTKSINFLVDAFSKYRTRDWAPGPKGHVLRALSLYHRRVYGDARPWVAGDHAAQQLRRAYR